MKLTTTTLLPFAPHQQETPPTSPRTHIHSRLPGLFNRPCPMSSSSPIHLIGVPCRPNTLRVKPSIISEASYESSSSSSSSSSASSSPSLPDVPPTSCSTPVSPLPPPSPPPPPSRPFGKSRPLPQPPRFPQPPPPSLTGPNRPRTPPPAWSPPGTQAPAPARPTLPRLVAPSSSQTQPRQFSATQDVRLTSASPRVSTDRPISSLLEPPRIRPLPMRPVPPGPPSEDSTPVAPFGRTRWPTDTFTILEEDTYDDQRTIDWDLIDEVMMHSG